MCDLIFATGHKYTNMKRSFGKSEIDPGECLAFVITTNANNSADMKAIMKDQVNCILILRATSSFYELRVFAIKVTTKTID